jgi:hypothetical protein
MVRSRTKSHLSSDKLQDFKEERMKFRPLHDRVVVERIDAEAMTAGGFPTPPRRSLSRAGSSASVRAAATITAT